MHQPPARGRLIRIRRFLVLVFSSGNLFQHGPRLCGWSYTELPCFGMEIAAVWVHRGIRHATYLLPDGERLHLDNSCS